MELTLIDDDVVDVVTVGWEYAAYGFDEDAGTVEACASLTGGTLRAGHSVAMSYETADDTARAAADYTAGSGKLTLDTNTSRACVQVALLDDTLVESAEDFALRITSVEGMPVASVTATIDTQVTVVTVADDDVADVVAVNWEYAAYSIDENGGAVEACVYLVGSLQTGRSVKVSYETVDDTARAATDYTAGSGKLTLDTDTSRACVEVTVLDDELVEGLEDFELRLTNVESVPPASVTATLDAPSVTVRITDDDVDSVSVRWENYRPHVHIEGQMVDKCVVMEGTLRAGRSVEVSYEAVDDTALVGADYTVSPPTMTLDAQTTQACVQVSITDDEEVEWPWELFGLRITQLVGSPASAVTVHGPVATEIAMYIKDNDFATALQVGWEDANPRYVAERSGAVTACVAMQVSGGPAQETMQALVQASRTVTVDYTTEAVGLAAAAASADYTPASGTLTLTPVLPAAGTPRACTQVTVLDDREVESREQFVLRLSDPVLSAAAVEGPPVELSEAVMQFWIEDDEVAATAVTVGWEQTAYTVNEGAGEVEVCVSLLHDAALQTGQSVALERIRTVDGTAAAAADYTAVDAGTETIAALDSETSRRCLQVPILDDALAEAAETFTLRIEDVEARPDGGVSARIDPIPVTVTVLDNDIVPAGGIGWEHKTYSVAEDAGSLELCALLAGALPAGQRVVVGYEWAGDSAVAGADFSAGSGTFTFASGGDTRLCADVELLADTEVEPVETLNARLTLQSVTPPSPAVRLQPAVAELSILDTTETFLSLRFDAAEYTLVEGGSVDVCVAWSARLPAGYEVENALSLNQQLFRADKSRWSIYAEDANVSSGRHCTSIHHLNAGGAGQSYDLSVASHPLYSIAFTLNTWGQIRSITDQARLTLVHRQPRIVFDAAVGEVRENFPGPVRIGYRFLGGHLAEGEQLQFRVYILGLVPGYIEAGTGLEPLIGSPGLFLHTVSAASGAHDALELQLTDNQSWDGDRDVTIFVPHPYNQRYLLTVLENDAPPATDQVAVYWQDTTVSVIEGETHNACVVLSRPLQAGETVDVAYASVDELALAPADYTAVSGTLHFATGDTERCVDVVTTEDTVLSAHKRFSLQLSAPSGTGVTAVLGFHEQEITLRDDERYQIGFASPTGTGEEGAGVVYVPLTIAPAVVAGRLPAVQVKATGYAGFEVVGWEESTQQAAVYTRTLAAGDTTVSFPLLPADDEAPAVQVLNLGVQPGADYTVDAAAASHVLTITDNDAAVSVEEVTVLWWPDEVHVREDANEVRICAGVLGTLWPHIELVVPFRIENQDAQVGSDYHVLGADYSRPLIERFDFSQPQSAGILGTIRPAPIDPSGELSPLALPSVTRCLALPLIDDSTAETPEVFTVRLLAPTTTVGVAAELHTETQLRVTVYDDDAQAQATVGWESAARDVEETAGEVELCAALSGTLAGPLTVPYVITGIATADQDYTTAAYTVLEFNQGSRRACVALELVDDDVADPNETLTLTLEQPVEFAGEPAVAALAGGDDAYPGGRRLRINRLKTNGLSRIVNMLNQIVPHWYRLVGKVA